MKVGITQFVTDRTIDIVSLARHCERLGFESLWVPEHPVVPVDMTTPFPGSADGKLPDFYKRLMDPFVGLAAAAGATEKILLGTGICLVPERNPLYTAKEVATVDRVSNGRFLFGIGAGWIGEEAEVFGVDFPRRWTQTREFVQALKVLWSEEHPEFHGKYVDFPKVWCYPKPIQQPHPPILIAGELERMAARVADYGDGWIPRGRAIDPAGVEQGRARIAGLYRERGRDPAQLTVSIYGADPDRESNRRFADAGTDRVVHMLPSKGEAETVKQREHWAAELL